MIHQKMTDQPKVVLPGWILRKLRATVFVRLSLESHTIRIALAQVFQNPVKVVSMAHLILRHGTKGNILFQRRTDAGPLGVPVTINQLVIRHFVKQCFQGFRIHCCRHWPFVLCIA